MTDPDDELEEPSLSAMRSVWREMRDEEPPSRGLAELLAAARAQVAPKPEPGWKRALSALAAMFRRPPVLALATVIVLIGGGLLIGRSRDVTVEPAVQKQDRDRGGKDVPADVDLPVGGDKQDKPKTSDHLDELEKNVDRDFRAGSGSAAPVAASPEGQMAVLKEPPVVQPAHRNSPPPAPRGQGGTVPRPTVTAETPPTTTAAPPPPPPPPPPETPAQELDRNGAGGGPETVTGANASDDRSPPADTSAAAPPPASTPTSHDGRRQTAQQQQPDLVQQCKTAAARGDCATAKRLANQVAKQNASAYRAMTGDAAVAKCLQ